MKNLISQVTVYLSEEGLHPVVEVVRFFSSSQGCHANLFAGGLRFEINRSDSTSASGVGMVRALCR